MKEKLINTIISDVQDLLNSEQLSAVKHVLQERLQGFIITEKTESAAQENASLVSAFISAKKVEGCSLKTLKYYETTIDLLLKSLSKPIRDINTNDIRTFLADYQETHGISKVTTDNVRRIFSSFFSWLEDEDYITKSPVRRIHKVRTDIIVKEVISDENLEVLRDNCNELRDLAMVDFLASTGIRVGELVNINREDINFQERQCVVFGKGNKEREVYFNARAKVHLLQYLDSRTDKNPALFVSFAKPYNRLSISGVEKRLKYLGRIANVSRIHPHKFRRTLATTAINRGMPIEQVQRLLGHVKIDTTLHYAMVNQENVKVAHRKFF